MWHVDEGALHAYLDGALDEYPAAEARRVREHLETCAECADRLAEERRVREQAQEILGLAAPGVEAPTFEELRAYVRAQQPARTAASLRLYRLSWAASVVLALGTGWLLRGGVPPTTSSSGGARFESDRITAGEAAPAEAPGATSAAPEPSNEAAVTSGPPATSPTRDAPVAERAERAVARAGPRADVAERLEEMAVTAQPTELADASGGDPAGAPASDTTTDRLAADTRRAAPDPTVAAQVVENRARTAADVARQDTAMKEVEAASPATAEPRLSSAIAAPAPAAGFGGAVTPLGRAAADAAEVAQADDDTTSLVVPGLEVLDVLPVGQGTTFAGMRALQRLQTGDTLELVHLPEAIDPASLPPLRPGWSELVRARGSGWLVMRAPVPEASLLELLQRLESGR
jgi:anti-sigma factor RsiW